MPTNVAPALRALLERLIDYAGTFPPATLTRDEAIANYRRYRAGEHSWMLGRLVVSAAGPAACAPGARRYALGPQRCR